MSLHYLIDGYNLLYALPEMPPGSWQEKRAGLIRFIEQKRPQGNNPVTFVFDSREGLGERQQQGDVTIVFTAGESADDWISRRVREAPNPRALMVVSDDRGIQLMVRGTGARFITAHGFLEKTINPKGQRERRTDPRANTDAITDEFRKKWAE